MLISNTIYCMDLNDIELSPFLIASLYRSTIVELDGPAKQTTPPTRKVARDTESYLEDSTGEWKSLGENKKNILIILSNKDVVYLPDDELQFLTGILNACRLSLADVAIVNIANNPEANHKVLTQFFKSRIVLLFAVEPTAFGLPISFPQFQIQPFANNSFLFLPTLKELEMDKLLKSKLWLSLKRLFNV